MQTYDRVQGDETGAYIKARIFIGNEHAEAELHNGGPATEGAEYIGVPSGSLSVPDALKLGEELAAKHRVPFLVQMDDATWDQAWGMLRV